MPEFTWSDLLGDTDTATLLDIMAETDLFPSKGEIRRLIQQGAVKLNEIKKTDANELLTRSEENLIIRAGKRIFFKVIG